MHRGNWKTRNIFLLWNICHSYPQSVKKTCCWYQIFHYTTRRYFAKKCNPRKDDLLDITFLYGGSKVKTVWIEVAVRLIKRFHDVVLAKKIKLLFLLKWEGLPHCLIGAKEHCLCSQRTEIDKKTCTLFFMKGYPSIAVWSPPANAKDEIDKALSLSDLETEVLMKD